MGGHVVASCAGVHGMRIDGEDGGSDTGADPPTAGLKNLVIKPDGMEQTWLSYMPTQVYTPLASPAKTCQRR